MSLHDLRAAVSDMNVKVAEELLSTNPFSNDELYTVMVDIVRKPWDATNTENMMHLIAKHVSGDLTTFFNAPMYSSTSLLMDCLHKGHVDVLVYLGADVNWQNCRGETALMNAVSRKERVTTLLTHGANVNIRSFDGWNVVNCASSYVNSVDGFSVLQILVEAGADLGPSPCYDGTPLITMCHVQPECKKGIKYLIEQGSPVDHVARNGWTALKALCRWSTAYKTIKWFVSSFKPFLDLIPTSSAEGNYDNRSALMVAAEYGNTDIVKLLTQEFGATINLTNDNGQTALDVASQSYQLERNINTITCLVKMGGRFRPVEWRRIRNDFRAYLRDYPNHFLDGLYDKLAKDLVELVIDKDLPIDICRKIDLEYGHDISVEDVFNLPYHRIQEGVATLVSTWKKEAVFHQCDKGKIAAIDRVLEAIAKVAHNCSESRRIAQNYADEYETQSRKKLKLLEN